MDMADIILSDQATDMGIDLAHPMATTTVTVIKYPMLFPPIVPPYIEHRFIEITVLQFGDITVGSRLGIH